MQGGLLGALIALDPAILYTAYLMKSPPSVPTVLSEQHLRGAVMWFSGVVFFSVVA